MLFLIIENSVLVFVHTVKMEQRKLFQVLFKINTMNFKVQS